MAKPKFFRGFRLFCLCVLVLVSALSLLPSFMPQKLERQFLYPVKHADEIQAACDTFGVDPYLACAVIKTESDWHEDARSSAGAEGLMQLMPDTGTFIAAHMLGSNFDVSNMYDAKTNIWTGVAYLAYLQQMLGNEKEVIAAYNAGPGQVASWKSLGGNIEDHINFSETSAYLTKVEAAKAKYQELYPQGISQSE